MRKSWYGWLLFLLSFVLWGCRGEGEYVTDERILGYRGKAKVNPYLAAERLLESGGVNAKTGRIWPRPDQLEEYRTILMPVSYLQTRAAAKQVLSWVEKGGFLILFLEGGESYLNDFADPIRGEFQDEENRSSGFSYLLDEIEGEVVLITPDIVEGEGKAHLSRDWHEAEVAWSVGEENHQYVVEFEGETGPKFDHGMNWDTEGEGARMASTTYGRGSVMMMSHARPFRNAFIERGDHANFIEAIVQSYGSGDVLFLVGSGASFFSILWDSAWPVVVGFLIFLAFWLWKRIPRFGPILNDPALKKADYESHLLTSARFLWHHDQIGVLIGPLRDQVRESRSEEESDDQFYERLSNESGISLAKLKLALSSPPPRDGATLIQQTHILRKITQAIS